MQLMARRLQRDILAKIMSICGFGTHFKFLRLDGLLMSKLMDSWFHTLPMHLRFDAKHGQTRAAFQK